MPWSTTRGVGKKTTSIVEPPEEEFVCYMQSLYEPLTKAFSKEFPMDRRVFSVYALYILYKTQIVPTRMKLAKVKISVPVSLLDSLQVLVTEIKQLQNLDPLRIFQILLRDGIEFTVDYPRTWGRSIGFVSSKDDIENQTRSQVENLLQGLTQQEPVPIESSIRETLRLRDRYVSRFCKGGSSDVSSDASFQLEELERLRQTYATPLSIFFRNNDQKKKIDPHITVISNVVEQLGTSQRRTSKIDVSLLLYLATKMREYTIASNPADEPEEPISELQLARFLHPNIDVKEVDLISSKELDVEDNKDNFETPSAREMQPSETPISQRASDPTSSSLPSVATPDVPSYIRSLRTVPGLQTMEPLDICSSQATEAPKKRGRKSTTGLPKVTEKKDKFIVSYKVGKSYRRKTFSFKKCGSRSKAKDMAIEWRNSMSNKESDEKVGAETKSTKKRSRSGSTSQSAPKRTRKKKTSIESWDLSLQTSDLEADSNRTDIPAEEAKISENNSENQGNEDSDAEMRALEEELNLVGC
eukprot:CAMPEP_0167741952 /NCGR_PEP_ID=MMETSP0110_2-20121227/1147_1 /TAXON_ID=629695 /ORGANISM="Gymnochlora sp., Strain CCMP2014" /LENGTH=527 /DNA_ID=CAMNT_0007626071 /DNA_START=42 /DNA_END=1625 /DNA_ORIENTATION=+